jgi:hypothetical protein
MTDLKKYPDPVWDRFFGFIYPDVEPATREEVQQELQRLGLDVRKAVSRVHLALQASQARAALETARAERPRFMDRIKHIVAPVSNGLREHLQTVIGQKLQGSVQAAYFRKLESAATDDDLHSLLEDIHRLEALDKGAEDAEPPDK